MKNKLLFSLWISLTVSLAAFSQRVPVIFDKYHGFTGTENYLKAVARAGLKQK